MSVSREQVQVKDLEEMTVVYVRHIGPYAGDGVPQPIIERATGILWLLCRLAEFCRELGQLPTELGNRFSEDLDQ